MTSILNKFKSLAMLAMAFLFVMGLTLSSCSNAEKADSTDTETMDAAASDAEEITADSEEGEEHPEGEEGEEHPEGEEGKAEGEEHPEGEEGEEHPEGEEESSSSDEAAQ